MPQVTMFTYTTATGAARLPATIDGIRSALPAELHAGFDAEVGGAPADARLTHTLALWALRTRPELMDQVEAQFARLEAEDFGGCTLVGDGGRGRRRGGSTEYRVQMAPLAHTTRGVLPPDIRTAFEEEAEETLGRDPHGILEPGHVCSSSILGRGDRHASTIAGVVVLYHISGRFKIVTAAQLVMVF